MWERLKRKEIEVLDDLALHFGARLVRVAASMLGTRNEAEDLVQDTLVLAWKQARKASGSGDLASWLTGITCNLCRNRLRSRKRRRERESRWQALQERMTLAQGALRLETDELLAVLMPEKREVLVLRYLEGLSVAETAQALTIPEGTVRSRTHTALKELKAKFGHEVAE